MAAKEVLQQQQPALRRLLEAINNDPLKVQPPLRGTDTSGSDEVGQTSSATTAGFWRGINCRKPSEAESTNAFGRKKMCCSASYAR